MKILVMSDSHKAKNNILTAIEAEKPNMVLHLGDHEKDCVVIKQAYPELDVRTVPGNCDGWGSGVDVDEFMLEGKRFIMTHGHIFDVKSTLSSILSAATSRKADILLYGHTHIPHFEIIDNLTVLNPGSISEATKSYAVLEIENGNMECELKKI